MSDPWPVTPPEPEPEAPTSEELEARRQARIIRHAAETFVDLSKLDGTQLLLREMEKKRAKMEREFVSTVRSGMTDLGDEKTRRQIDYDRGFMDALKYPAEVLATAKKLLEQWDEEAADRLLESEPDDESEVWAP